MTGRDALIAALPFAEQNGGQPGSGAYAVA